MKVVEMTFEKPDVAQVWLRESEEELRVTYARNISEEKGHPFYMETQSGVSNVGIKHWLELLEYAGFAKVGEWVLGV